MEGGTTFAHNCGQRKHAGLLCWLFVSTTDRLAGVKPKTRSVVHVLSAKAHRTVAACLTLCPALHHSKAPYAARAGSPGHLQDHHKIASASPSFDLSILLLIFPSLLLTFSLYPSFSRSLLTSPFYGKLARSISKQGDTLSESKD